MEMVYIGPVYNNQGHHLVRNKIYYVDFIMFGNQARYLVTELESEDPIRMENGGYAYFELRYFKSRENIRNEKLLEILK